MIRKIRFPSRLAQPLGLEPPQKPLHGLGKLVVLAGPNGAGKSRYLQLLQQVIAFAREGLSSQAAWREQLIQWRATIVALRNNIDIDPDAREQQIQAHANAIGQFDDRLTVFGELETDPGAVGQIASQSVAVLTYDVNRTAVPRPENQSRAAANNVVSQNVAAGFAGAHQSIAIYFERVAKDLWNAKHPEAIEQASVKDAAKDAASFNETLDALVGGRIEPMMSAGPEATAKFRGRAFEYAELSSGEAVLIAWAIILHRQKSSLSDAIVIIDEPENHLHPDACIRALTALRDKILGPNGQIWLGTHSVQLIAFAGMDSIWMVDKGRIEYAGNKVDTVIDRLLGGSDGRNRLRAFLADADDLGFYKFAAECLTGPDVVDSKTGDPQEAQFVDGVRDRSEEREPLHVFDYGAGKGRLAAALLGMAEDGAGSSRPVNVHYYAYNGPHASDTETSECRARVRDLVGSGRMSAEYVDDLRTYCLSAAQKMDRVVLCNVLHEIPVEGWLSTFQEIARILKPDGSVLIMEDQNMGLGELPTAHGFIVLDLIEIAELFNTTPQEVRKLPSARNGRLTQVAVPYKVLGSITAKQIGLTLQLVQERAHKKVVELRGQKDPSFQAGRLHAYFSMLYVNATLALNVFSQGL